MEDVHITKEQRERMRRNRERALEIQKKRKREEQEHEENRKFATTTTTTTGSLTSLTATTTTPSSSFQEGKKVDGNVWKRPQILLLSPNKLDTTTTTASGNDHDEEEEELEDFEVNASPYVTKKEAMKMYLLSEGTLAVCKYMEKENPHCKKWTCMKLYDRMEIRRRSHKQWCGIQGLIKERIKRQEKRFQNDLHKTKNLFSTTTGSI